MQIEDLSSTTYAPEMHEGFNVQCIGWLGSVVASFGDLPNGFLDAIRWLRIHSYHDDEDLGYHTCEICGAYDDRGELWLETEKVRYVAPAMILHYCVEHEYLPPMIFVDQLLNAYNDDQRGFGDRTKPTNAG